jgi:hypothetical protein
LELKGRTAEGSGGGSGLRMMIGTTTGNRVEETPGSMGSRSNGIPATQEVARRHKRINFSLNFNFGRPILNFSGAFITPMKQLKTPY